MNPKAITTLLLSFLLFFACARKGNNSEVSAVQAAWDQFRNASWNKKGEIAANRVTKQTHDYYRDVRADALNATREELQRMSLARQITVLGMRLQVSPEELESMTGRELFVHAVDQGWIGKNIAGDEGVVEIQVTGDRARANATKAGHRTDQLLHFIKEDGAWRFDMMPLMTLANGLLNAIQKESGLGEEKFVARFIENVTGRPFSDSDWNPPRTKQGAGTIRPVAPR